MTVRLMADIILLPGRSCFSIRYANNFQCHLYKWRAKGSLSQLATAMLRERCLSTMGVSSPAKKRLPSGSSPPHALNSDKHDNNRKKQLDPNMTDPRLLVNRPCIYERQLPGDAYITAHVQRLQHGFYYTPALPDLDAKQVDFLAISFVFHPANTLSHRFKSATICVRITGDAPFTMDAKERASNNPSFLMHAPHLIFGTVSPETLNQTLSLAGSLGISETPVSASLIPSGSVNKQYQRYEMLYIQGSARTLKSSRGHEFDAENGEILWSLEENHLQRSGLPREFTVAMLVQKPSANRNIHLSLDVDPVIASPWGSYPTLMLSLPSYRPDPRPSVDFSREVGQRFEPADGPRGFNFAKLVGTFDAYFSMPGRKFSHSMEIPPPSFTSPTSNFEQGYPGQYGFNPMPQLQGNAPGNALLEWQLRQLRSQTPGVMLAAPPVPATTGMVGAIAGSTADVGNHNTINVRVGLEPAMMSQLSKLPIRSPFSPVPDPQPPRQTWRYDPGAGEYGRSLASLAMGVSRNAVADAVESWLDGVPLTDPDWRPIPDLGSGDQSYEAVRADMLRTVHPGNREDREAPVRRVMALENRPLSPERLATLPEGSSEEQSEEE